MNPRLGYIFYKNYIFNEDFNIQTAHSISFHNEVIEIPVFKIFNVNAKHKFYLFDFSKKYDGLIGIDLLKQLNASVNLHQKLIITPTVQIPIIYESEDLTNFKNKLKLENYKIVVPERTTKIVKLPVNIKSGIGCMNYIKFDNQLESPQSLVNIEDYFIITSVTNSSTEPKIITISRPFDIEQLNINEINFIEKMETDEIFTDNHDRILKENLKQIRMDHCNQEESDAIKNLCLEYRDIFYCENIPLTFSNTIKHKINLTDESPIYTRQYRYPQIYKDEVKSQIEKMLSQGIIQPSSSPFSSPLWVVEKRQDASKKRKYRLVLDYRKLNEKTVDDKYPLPNINDILDKLGKSQYFSTLDLANGFHQIQMDENDIQKTAFSTEHGHYEFTRMPFGLKNAPSTFQRVMDNILRGLQNETCLVYLDDIVIFSTSLQEHMLRLRQIFDRLRDANFKLQLDKSEFLRKEVNYLGHVITPLGVKPNPEKISAVKKFPIPKTTKEIKGFLGLVGYYRKFIQDFAKITKPLTKCLKKGAQIIHDQDFINAFETCKNLLTNAPILQYPDFSKKFILTTDASNVALGAILSQGPIGSDKPIAYASRTLNDSEQRYSTIEKELLAIVWACKMFRSYLFGRKFSVVTDHRSLVWLFKLREPNSKLVRWRLKLEEFDYDVIYKKGKANTNADALSRISINALENESLINNPGDIDNETLRFLRRLSENPVEDDNLDNSTSNQSKIKILSDVQVKPPDEPSGNDSFQSTQHTTANETTNDGIKILDEIINNKINQILVFGQIYHKLTIKQENYENHKIITVEIPSENNEELILEFLKDYTTHNKTYCMYFHTDKLYKCFNEVYLKHFSEKGPKLIKCTKLVNTVTDKEDQILLIKNHHESKTNHRGISETIERLKKNYYWIGIKDSVTNFINSCDICQKTKYARKNPYSPLMITETASKPFQIVHVDLFFFDKKIYLTIVDSFTKFAQAQEVIGKTAIHISNGLIKYFASFGVPEKLIIDNGTEFNNEVIQEILKLHKIKIHFTTVGHHESNAIVERFHSSIIEHLRILKSMYPNDIENIMNYAILGYNSSIHSATNFTPFELTFGHTHSRNPNEIFLPATFYSDYAENHKLKLEYVYKNVKEKLESKKEKLVSKLNSQGDSNEEFQVGLTVYKQNSQYRNKKDNKFLGPYTLTKLLDKNRAEITNQQNNKSEIIHIKELKKPFVTGSSQPSTSQTAN
ncbi:reverse transcriptase domain-containing protein [Wolbachia endosymbiont of Psylliodes chrysocephala]|uniref:reverse transcriptase domain-containing protein n=1 Tax=Wolbachia endosymbiont of Psylliodes chrysocephala TaxID=2883236 RepID=UPI00209F6395|nr:reverse transcriptase domain-containing protein [Wolbachia endosymbiont of Psylliodes chrysocephala]